MPKKVTYNIRMKDGTMKPVAGMQLRPGLNYHKDPDTGLYFLDSEKTGTYIATATKLKELKELIQEPEFFEEPLTVRNILEAVIRWTKKKFKP